MGESWTIRRVVRWITDDLGAREVSSARLEADLLVAHALGIERIQLYMDADRPLSQEELAAIRALVKRRREHEPVAYILGRREFYGRSFEVTPDVLIPRPDTETLLEATVAAAVEVPDGPFVELCTGSGALAVSLALELPGRTGVGTDISEAALAVAKRNAAQHEVQERLEWLCGDLLGPLAGRPPSPLVVVNPPYIRSAELATLEPDVRDHEPRLALDGGDDGMTFYRRLAAEAAEYVVSGGRLLMEVGYDQAAAVAALFDAGTWQALPPLEDLGGIHRVVSVQRSA